MARPLRIEFPGALYHVTARGDRREDIYEDDPDRQLFLSTLGECVEQFNWLCHTYCLMSNHYHLIIETPEANLSQGMRQLNGVFTQATNRRHRRSGHLFQGRYKAILVERDAYLLELSRYVVLNPVRAGMVKRPAQWPWSSYRAMVGRDTTPAWLTADGLLAEFAKRRATARKRYTEFVMKGKQAPSPWQDLKGQIYLGSDRFVKRVQGKIKKMPQDVNIPKAQRRSPAPPLDKIAQQHAHRDKAIRAAHASGQYSYQAIGDYFGLHFTTVGSIVRRARHG